MSFFADLLGGAALSGEKILGDQIEQQQALERQDHQSQLEIERQKTIDANRAAAAEQLRQQTAQRSSEQLQQAETGGQAIGDARDVGLLQRLQMGVKGSAPNASAEDLAAKMQDPAVRATYEKAGYIKPGTALSAIDDQLAAARKGGLYDAEAHLKGAREETVKAMREDWRQKFEQGKLDNTDRKNDITEARNEQRHKEAMAAIAKSGPAGASHAEKVTTYLEGQRRLLDSQTNQLQTLMGNELDIAAKNGDTAGAAAIKATYSPRLKALSDRQVELDGDYKTLRGQFGLPTRDAPAPGGAPTPGGKTAPKVTVSNWK